MIGYWVLEIYFESLSFLTFIVRDFSENNFENFEQRTPDPIQLQKLLVLWAKITYFHFISSNIPLNIELDAKGRVHWLFTWFVSPNIDCLILYALGSNCRRVGGNINLERGNSFPGLFFQGTQLLVLNASKTGFTDVFRSEFSNLRNLRELYGRNLDFDLVLRWNL